MGDSVAFDMVSEIAATQIPVAPIARIILERWETFKPLAEAKSQMDFYRLVAGLMRKERDRAFSLFDGGTLPAEVVASLFYFACAINGIYKWIEKNKMFHPSQSLDEVSVFYHDHVANPLQSWASLGRGLGTSPITLPLPLPKLRLDIARKGELKNYVYEAVRRDLLTIAARKIDVEIDVPDGISLDIPDYLTADLSDSIVNLVQNAIKYSDPAKEEKWIRIKWDGDLKILTIADNGLGISNIEAALQGHREHPEIGGEGVSLGLPSVKERLKALGWKMSTESQVGVGTTVTLTLPWISGNQS